MNERLSDFAAAARAFCSLVEQPPATALAEHSAGAIARLYAAGVGLPAVEARDINVDDLAPEKPRTWPGFEVQYYGETVDPLDVELLEVGPGDLEDDILDIYADVAACLRAYEAGIIKPRTGTGGFG